MTSLNYKQSTIFNPKNLKVLILMGLVCFLKLGNSQDIIITEIMYNPPESGTDSLEYIELFNNTNNSINLEGYSFSSGVSYSFPNIEIQSNNFIVVCVDSMAFLSVFGLNAYEWKSGGLSNSGESIVIKDKNSITVDSVSYDDSAPWPKEPISPDGEGSSIRLCNFQLNNNDGTNWEVSKKSTNMVVNTKMVFGSPGSMELCCEHTYSTQTINSCDSFTFNGKIYTTSGLYKDTIKNEGGCDSIITFNLTITKVNTKVKQEGAVLIGEAVDASFEWLKCNGGNNFQSTGEFTKEFKVNLSGEYAVVVTQNECADTSNCINVVISNLENRNEVLIETYPNPTTGQINVDLGKVFKNVNIQVINSNGQIIETTHFKQLRKTKIYIREAAGVYYLKINSGNSLRAKIKVLKE